MCVTFFCLYPYCAARKLNKIVSHEEKSQSQPINASDNIHLKHHNSNKIEQGGNTQKYQHNNMEEVSEKQEIKFVIAFNRDEQTQRRTLKMGPFEQDRNIYAGRDTKSTGTWLGINVKTAIMVVLTNYDLPEFRPGKSRGKLVQFFLRTAFIPPQLLNSPNQIDSLIKQKLIEVLKESKQYAAFNLFVYNMRSDSIFYICSELGMKDPSKLNQNTVYGLCNTDLNTIWPKTKYGCLQFENILKKYENKSEAQLMDALSTLMRDNKSFSKNLNDEASIFVQPFFSTLENAERMTKSTFIAIVRITKQNQKSIHLRQITHSHTKQQVNIAEQSAKKYKSKKSHENYDHLTEFVVDLQFDL